MKKTSNVFCAKTQQLFNRKGKNCFGYGKFREKAKCFQPSVVICKINGKGNQQFLAGFAGKTLLICQKVHVAFSMQKNKLFVQFSIRSMFWQNVQETFVKVQRNY